MGSELIDISAAEQVSETPIVQSSVCKAGKLALHYNKWCEITTDKYVLDCVQGYKIPFKTIPVQEHELKNSKLIQSDSDLVELSIEKLVFSSAIVKSFDEPNQFVSPIFTVPKPDGSRRPILNLKKLNEFVDCPHFKMENFKTVSSLVSKSVFMAVMDLKDAYHAVPIFNEHQKFSWNGQLYKYTCLPFGLCIVSLHKNY